MQGGLHVKTYLIDMTKYEDLLVEQLKLRNPKKAD